MASISARASSEQHFDESALPGAPGEIPRLQPRAPPSAPPRCLHTRPLPPAWAGRGGLKLMRISLCALSRQPLRADFTWRARRLQFCLHLSFAPSERAPHKYAGWQAIDPL